MNIFVLDTNPVIAAQQQCDKHVVKMIVESAQMLSTAHRLLDGTEMIEQKYVNGSLPARFRNKKVWKMQDNNLEQVLYRVAHAKHPCTIWTMESSCNYEWHYRHFIALCDEYTYRYGKVHATDIKLRTLLKQHPINIPKGDMTKFALAMKAHPECMFEDDPVKSYRMFYETKKDRFKMIWSKRNTPEWFNANLYS